MNRGRQPSVGASASSSQSHADNFPWEKVAKTINLDGGRQQLAVGRYVNHQGGRANSVVAEHLDLGNGRADEAVVFKSANFDGGRIGKLYCTAETEIRLGGGRCDEQEILSLADLIKKARAIAKV